MILLISVHKFSSQDPWPSFNQKSMVASALSLPPLIGTLTTSSPPQCGSDEMKDIWLKKKTDYTIIWHPLIQSDISEALFHYNIPISILMQKVVQNVPLGTLFSCTHKLHAGIRHPTKVASEFYTNRIYLPYFAVFYLTPNAQPLPCLRLRPANFITLFGPNVHIKWTGKHQDSNKS